MNRSGYSDDCDNVQLWRQAVDNAILGARGQAFMRRLRDALDALPTKRLIAGDLAKDGDVCALGAVDPESAMKIVDIYDRDEVAAYFHIAPALAAEIVFMNDEWKTQPETPEERWQRMRAWVDRQIGPDLSKEGVE